MQATRPPHVTTLIMLTGLSVLTLNMFVPALPAIANDFGASEAVMALSVSGYLVVAGLLQLIIGPVSDFFGRRPVVVICMGLYLVASLGCALAVSSTMFLGFRLLQGVVIAGPVISQAVIRDMFDREDAASKMGTVAAAMALAPMLGPMAGGMLFEVVGWRGEFVLYTVFGLAAYCLVLLNFGETRPERVTPLRWSDYTELLRERLFWIYALCMTFSVGAFYIFIAGVPFVAGAVFGLPPVWIGLGIGSITGGFMIGAAITARCVQRFGIHRLMLVGRSAALAGLTVGLAAFLMGAAHPLWLFGCTLFVGFGNGLTLANANAGATSIRPSLAGTAAGLVGALMVAGGAVLTAVTAVVLTYWLTPVALLAIMLTCVAASLMLAVAAARCGR